MMKSPALSSDQTVAQVLQEFPDAARALISLRMNCVGCYLMRFCTLEYAAHSYHKGAESLLAELAKAIEGTTKTL